MRKLDVFGAEVDAPVCGKCSMNDYVIVREMPSSWCYWCTKCDRCIPFEEFKEGNP